MNHLSLEVNHLRKSYGRPVLVDICLSMKSGEVVAVTGNSGCGKSTLLNILGLMETFDGGDYIFNGKKIISGWDYSALRRKEIGFIFQNYHLLGKLSCRENIELPGEYIGMKRKQRWERAEQLAAKVGIETLLDQSSDTLSGGEKQRAGIARALMNDPGFLIADEPTGNLDRENADLVQQILWQEAASGRGVLLITHDRSLAQLADRQFLLENGRLKPLC